jgi:Secretion system C-terminal sorting domain
MGAANRTLTAVFTKSTSVEDILDAQFNVYPNPTTGIFYVKSNNQLEVKEWSVSDVVGRKILRGPSFKENEINLSAFNEGIYFLQVVTDKGDIIKRIVLQK